MIQFSLSKLSEIILSRRKVQNLTQQELADKAGINRSVLCRLEKQDYVPSLDQLSLCLPVQIRVFPDPWCSVLHFAACKPE